MPKNIIKSKTFWFNILALLNELVKVLPISESVANNVTLDHETLLPLVAAGNIVLRKFTSKAVTVMPQEKKPSLDDYKDSF